MRSGQGKSGELGMIELRADPAVHGVAQLALVREADAGVVGIGGMGKFRRMAGNAGRG